MGRLRQPWAASKGTVGRGCVTPEEAPRLNSELSLCEGPSGTVISSCFSKPAGHHDEQAFSKSLAAGCPWLSLDPFWNF